MSLDTYIHRWDAPANAPFASAGASSPAEAGAIGTTLLLLHGTGGDENNLLPIGRMLLPGAGILSLRGDVLENGMPRFFRRLAEGVFDQDDLRARITGLDRFLDSASARYGFDRNQLFAVGYSNGANIAAGLLLTASNAMRGAILLHAMTPFKPQSAPELNGAPIFMGAGRNDPIARPDNTETLASILRSSGAEVTLYWHENGHSLTRPEIEASARWLKGVLSTP